MNKILLINNGYPSRGKPYYSTYIKSIHQCLLKAGFLVDIIVLDTNFKNKLFKLLNYIKYYVKLLFFSHYQDYTYIYIHNYPHCCIPILFNFKSMNKIVIHWHGTDIFPPMKLGRLLAKFSYLFIPKKASHIAPSNFFGSQVAKILQISPESIMVSPSGGVDTDAFRPAKLARDTSKEIVLGYGSSLQADKGIDLVIDILNNTKFIQQETKHKVKLICINYGLEKEQYTKKIVLFENAKIIDPLPKDKMIDFYNRIDILLMPTTRMSESLGLVALEAMSCGIPVVGTDDFAICEYIKNGISGEKFRKGDKKSFLQAIIKAINNLANYQPRSIILKHYSNDQVIHQYSKYFGN